jgi:hypothetical protein
MYPLTFPLVVWVCTRLFIMTYETCVHSTAHHCSVHPGSWEDAAYNTSDLHIYINMFSVRLQAGRVCAQPQVHHWMVNWIHMVFWKNTHWWSSIVLISGNVFMSLDSKTMDFNPCFQMRQRRDWSITDPVFYMSCSWYLYEQEEIPKRPKYVHSFRDDIFLLYTNLRYVGACKSLLDSLQDSSLYPLFSPLCIRNIIYILLPIRSDQIARESTTLRWRSRNLSEPQFREA